MNHIELWTVSEQIMVDTIVAHVENTGLTSLRDQINESLKALEYQAMAISLYPSILESNRLGGSERNLQTLVTVLLDRYSDDDIFVLPTKAILSRSFEIGKINFLYMLYHACSLLKEYDVEIKENPYEAISLKIISIMTERVLLDLLSDVNRDSVRATAAATLAELWEGRITPESMLFNPELRSMWLIRKTITPVFGTLLGTHEYFSLIRHADENCRRYIMYSTSVPDEMYALEEFLFGLTYEELHIAKSELDKQGRSLFNKEDMAGIVGQKSLFFMNKGQNPDPIELYRFYNHRRNKAAARRELIHDGPTKTFEENLMVFLLSGMKTER
jgi:hypothetical protein